MVNSWSKTPNITVIWDAPSGSVSGYEYRYQGVGSDINDGQWRYVSERQASFAATQNGNHSLQIHSVSGSNQSVSIEAGPYLVDQQPPSLSVSSPLNNWVTTNDITVNWTGLDLLSGLSHYDVYLATNPSGPWTPLALSTTTEAVAITGDDDQTHYFRTTLAYDRAGNSTEVIKSVQVRTFPYLSVSPNPLQWTVSLSETAPSFWSLQILNNGGQVMPWTTQTDFSYLVLPTTNGTDDTTLPITLTHPLTYGVYSGVLTVTGTAETRNSPVTVPITINVVDLLAYYLPLIFKH